MANRKKKDEALAAVQAQTEGSGQPAVQSGYSAAGLDSRSEVENALANSSYKPSQTVTDAADALKEWQDNRRRLSEQLSGADRPAFEPAAAA